LESEKVGYNASWRNFVFANFVKRVFQHL